MHATLEAVEIDLNCVVRGSTKLKQGWPAQPAAVPPKRFEGLNMLKVTQRALNPMVRI